MWTPRSLGWFIVALGAFVWLFGSALILAHDFLVYSTGFSKSSVTLGALIVTALIFILALYMALRRDGKAEQSLAAARFEPPEPHRGLILPLPPYRRLGSDYELPELLELLTSEGNLSDLRAQIYRSNWAALMVAAEYHAPRLERCWLLCRKDGLGIELEAAARLIQAVAGKQVAIEQVSLPEEQEVSAVVRCVRDMIFRDARSRFHLPPKEMIADLTEGTLTISNGLVIACLQEGGAVQSLRGDARLLDPNTGVPLSIETIKARGLVLSLSTVKRDA